MILCDIGNTTYHFSIDGKEFKYFVNEELPILKSTVYFVSVNESGTAKLLSSYDDAINLEKYIDFKTQYKGMGLDRKIACFGLKNSIIVDAGSAITVDIMKKGEHKGGFILPGLTKIKDIYPEISVKLDVDFNVKVNLDTIPLNTQDAISYAILKSIISPIKEIAKDKQVIFTGGDGEFLSSFVENSVYKKNLIFEHMEGIIDANNCTA